MHMRGYGISWPMTFGVLCVLSLVGICWPVDLWRLRVVSQSRLVF